MRNRQQDEKICVGVITSANGVKGQVKIRCFTETPADIANFNVIMDENNHTYNIRMVTSKKDYIIAAVEGIQNRNQAETLRNIRLFINRNDLPELGNDEFYHADLIGLEARNKEGISLGIIKNIVNYGAGDIFEINDISSNKAVYIPFNKQFVPEIYMDEGYVVVEIPDEMVATNKTIE